MYGLDLFSGIGGLSLALKPWVRTIAYCENDSYCQAILLSRMSDGSLDSAPIWDNVQTINGHFFDTKPDIIYGGFPCQNVSRMGKKEGIKNDNQSGLWMHFSRLIREIKPRYVLVENVQWLTSAGNGQSFGGLLSDLARMGFDADWLCLSALEVGAPHVRDRIWILATAKNYGEFSHSIGKRRINTPKRHAEISFSGCICPQRQNSGDSEWSIEPGMGRVASGVPFRVDRLRGLGNSVVPAQAREAFKRLMGIGDDNEKDPDIL